MKIIQEMEEASCVVGTVIIRRTVQMICPSSNRLHPGYIGKIRVTSRPNSWVSWASIGLTIYAFNFVSCDEDSYL